jgi:hypothetical protein
VRLRAELLVQVQDSLGKMNVTYSWGECGASREGGGLRGQHRGQGHLNWKRPLRMSQVESGFIGSAVAETPGSGLATRVTDVAWGPCVTPAKAREPGFLFLCVSVL